MGCAGDSTPTGPGTTPVSSTLPFIVSSPTTPPSESVSRAAVRTNSPALAYISLPPGTFPTGLSATMADAHTGSTTASPLVNGGFDPAPLPAVVGDTVTVDVSFAAAQAPEHFSFLISGDRPLVIVRTDPPAHERVLPPDSRLTVVFSEPLDSAILNAQSVQLWMNITRIDGKLVFSDAAHTTVALTPAEELQWSTDYELIATSAVKGLNGDAFGAAFTVPFATIADSPPVPNSFLFQSSGAIWLYNVHDSTTTKLANGSSPVWSPDGSRIAFVGEFSATVAAAIYVMNADGSGLVRVANGENPSWSPDGTRIAFAQVGDGADDGNIDVVNADGTGLRWLIQGSAPAWSPDGTRIAFVTSPSRLPESITEPRSSRSRRMGTPWAN